MTEVREAVGVFDSAETLEAAVDELQSSGFDRAELSVLAGADTIGKKLGHRYEKVAELEDDATVPTTAFVSTEAIGDAQGSLVGAAGIHQVAGRDHQIGPRVEAFEAGDRPFQVAGRVDAAIGELPPCPQVKIGDLGDQHGERLSIRETGGSAAGGAPADRRLVASNDDSF